MTSERESPASTPPRGSGADIDRDGRREPLLGWLDGLDFRRPRRRRPGPDRTRWLWWIGGAFAGVLLLALIFRAPLADRLWPQNRAQALRTQAAQALAQGRLTAADGSGARELYEAALAIDPDRSDARTGLTRVALAAIAQAREATSRNRFADAHAALRLARELSAPRDAVAPVAAALRDREAAHAGLPALLARAEAARTAGDLNAGAQSALPLYRRVLALQPENDTALKGREDALGELLQQARAQLREGRLADAVAAVAVARDYDAGHVDLPETEARLNEEFDDVRRHAAADLRAGRLPRAAAAFGMLGDAGLADESRAGLDAVAKAYAQRAETLAGDFRFADARRALGDARALAPKLPALAEIERHIARAQQSQARLDNPLPPRERQRRAKALLAEAAQAEARGDLVTPPGDSAFDKLRAARALAPGDADVRRASARLLPTATTCFERELRGNNLARAGECLDARAIVDSDEAALAQARRRLARRWLDVGDERLGAGDLRGAAAALDNARRLDANAPGLGEFAARVRTAQAGHK